MMDPIKWKDEAFQAKTRSAIFGRQAEGATPERANSAALARLRELALTFRQLALRVREALPTFYPKRSVKSGTTAAHATNCSCS